MLTSVISKFFFQLTPNKKKSGRRKKHKTLSDTDASDYESNRKRTKVSDTVVNTVQEDEPKEQSVWGQNIPRDILYKIFQNVCHQDGALPMLVR